MTEILHGSITREECKSKAKKNCRQCYNRGVLDFDDGRIVITEKAEYRLMSKWTAACTCVERKINLLPDQSWHSRHPASKKPIFTGKK